MPVTSMTGRASFLSTLPARGATHLSQVGDYIQPISIHAPREGSDRVFTTSFAAPDRFLSTLPARGATGISPLASSCPGKFLSTLPARGATTARPSTTPPPNYFYPRSPRGERLDDGQYTMDQYQFLSTLPARGATLLSQRFSSTRSFLSTLPARGATSARP